MAFSPRIYYHPVLPSTMDEARRLAVSEHAPEGAVVQAGSQTAGRGRFGNQWSSPEGNLYMTLLLRPPVSVRVCAQMSFAIAIALSEALAGMGVPKASIGLKWPNDVLVDGRKIAGILLEMEQGADGRPDFLLAGIGVNVAVAPQGCVCVRQFNVQASLDSVRDSLLDAVNTLYAHWVRHGFADIRSRWLEQAFGVGQPIVARMADRTAEGVFEGIDADGNLLLRTQGGGVSAINSGAVHFRQP